jgi:hypothetical protein
MEAFKQGDFIRLRNIAAFHIERYSKETINIFEILSIEAEYASVIDINSKIPLSEIEPISINGKDDLKIYYSPIVMASIVEPGAPLPIRNKDYSYYYDKFLRCTYKGKNYQELIRERDLKYVHEVQHFLLDEHNCKGLKIRTY